VLLGHKRSADVFSLCVYAVRPALCHRARERGVNQGIQVFLRSNDRVVTSVVDLIII